MDTAHFAHVTQSATTDTMTAINQLLVDIKTTNHTITPLLRKAQYDLEQDIGFENEYSIRSLLNIIDGLVIQLLTMTAKRQQFLNQTAYTERKSMQNQLANLSRCLLETQQQLQQQSSDDLALLEAPLFVDALKPFSRMIELVTAQERIHALSAVLESLLSREFTPNATLDDCELSDEQNSALTLSHFLVKQAL